ncbi:MAG: Rubrerythrin [Deltaproteobacteria bacterium ADurb.Bin151]|nr:MAG: Rubrerythrin [Deltaproteobacteria bacterium ADurb.Bin151]
MKKYHVEKILKHALEIEEAGQKFYGILAQRLGDAKLKDIFTAMSQQEVGHAEIYKRMIDQQPSQPDPDDSDTSIFDFQKHEMLEDKIFNRLEIIRKGTKLYSLGDALALMIEIEMNVVDYFENVRRLVRLQDQPLMEKIINEEKSHVKQLVDLRSQYKAATRTVLV